MKLLLQVRNSTSCPSKQGFPVVASEPLYFNFHNLVTVEVNAVEPEDRAFFAAEYDNHWGNGALSGAPAVVLRFRRGPGWTRMPQGYTFHQHKLLARWGYRMQVSPERIELDVIGNRLSVPMVHHMLLHPSLRYLSARQGVLLLHAGAVAHLGRSLIFTGYGGADKRQIQVMVQAILQLEELPKPDDAADALRYLVATKPRVLIERKLSGL